MTKQLHLPGFPALPARPARRRCLWADELTRLARLTSDQRAHDRQHQAAGEARLNDALADLRHRVVDVERHVGVADIDRVPPPGPRLRAYQGR
jgi:hypothetical protein